MTSLGLLFSADLVLTALLLAVLARVKGKRYDSRLFLSLLILIFLYLHFLAALLWTDQFVILSHLLGTFRPLGYLIGPVLYWYIKSLTRAQFIWSWRETPHLVPAILTFFFVLPYFNADQASKIQMIQSPQYEVLVRVQFGLLLVFGLGYFVASLLELREYESKLKTLYSALERWNVNWLRRCLLATALIWLVCLSLVLIGTRGYHVNLISIAFCLSSYILAFSALYQSVLFNGEVQDQVIFPKKSDSGGDLKKTILVMESKSSPTMDPKELERGIHLIELAMVEKKLYRNSGLKLRDLAETVNIPEYLVSQIINSGFKTNFYDLVNGFRIREAKGLLSLRSRESSGILEIAYEVGFHDLSYFSRVFAAEFGKAPSEMR